MPCTRTSLFPSAYSAGAVTPQSVLDFHRLTFGSARMDAGDGQPDGDNPDDGKPDDKKPDAEADDAGLSEAGKRALQAERSARAAAERRAKDAEAQVQKFKDANLTDQQRLEKERDDAKSAHTQASSQLARYEAAEKAGLPLSWAKRLVGSTPDELESDAKAIKADLDAKSKPGTPRPDGSAGAGGTERSTTGSVSAGRDLYESRKKK